MRTERHKCGCVSELGCERWVRLCEKHQAEVNELRQRAAEDYRIRYPKEEPRETDNR